MSWEIEALATVDNHNEDSSERNDALNWIGLRLRPPGGPKQKAMAATFALTLLVGGFVADRVLDMASDSLFPDTAAIRAETLQNTIAGKVQSIESLSGKIYAELDGIDGEAAASIERDTKALMLAIDSLRPDILTAQSLSNDAARRFADAKQRDLATAGFSTEADFVVPLGDGATVCPDGYVFGTSTANSGTSEVLASLSGPHGKHPQVWIAPGEAVEVNTPDGVVRVSLQSFDSNGSGLMGYSVNCP